MNPSDLYTLTPEQKAAYSVQPDHISSFETKMHDEYEISQSVKGTSLRFWLNDLNEDFTMHWQTTIELILPVEKEYTVVANNTSYHLNPGDIFIIPPGIPHSIKSVPEGYRFVFLFEMDPLTRFQNYQHIRALLTNPSIITADTHPELYPTAISLIMEAAREYWSPDRYYKELIIYSILMKLLAEYGNYRIHRTESIKAPTNTPHELALRLNRVYQYIDDHLSENIQLEDAAKIANYSIYHFSRLFKESTGQTFSEYVRHVRIKAAQQLLQQVDTQIIWIAHECGFSSLSTFNRTFRSVTGSTPSEYRSLCSLPSSHMSPPEI
ncbi:MAG: helix-turn-helix transcriptional regulator [Clostridiales bacterium]|nr:helix-turn-helix transcriptional regulator [Candidatus Blautia equi]